MYWSLNAGAIGIRAPLPEVITLARRHGFAGVDFSIDEAAQLAAQHGVDGVRRLLTENNVRPSVWGLPVDWRGDRAKWEADLAALPRKAELAVALGSLRTVTWMPPSSDDRPYEENFRWHVERFRPIAEVLKPYGIRFGIEFIGPKTLVRARKYPFIHTLDGLFDLIRAIGTGNVGVLFDSWHWYTSGGTIADFDRLRNEDVVHVHLNDAPAGVPVDEQIDNVRCLPGETGVIDLTGFLHGLRRIGYDGPVAVEPFNQRVRELPADEAARVTAESLRKVWTAAGL